MDHIAERVRKDLDARTNVIFCAPEEKFGTESPSGTVAESGSRLLRELGCYSSVPPTEPLSALRASHIAIGQSHRAVS